jgi:hypothetical protein
MMHARNRASRTGSEGQHLHGQFRQALRLVFTTDKLCAGRCLRNIVEGGSGREFAVFFQFDRDGTSKGIVVIDPSKEIWE